MKIERLRIMRDGQCRPISSRFEEIEAVKGERVKFDTLLKNIEGKVDAIKSLNEQIVEMCELSDLEEEIAATDEYMVPIEIRLNEYKAYGNADTNTVRDTSVNQNADNTVDSEIHFSAQAMANAQYDDVMESDTGRNVENGNGNQTQTSSNTCNTFTQFHKLPKLSLPTFSGALLDWQTFWDSYDAAVHSNPTLTDIQKFTYLKSQLEGDAARSLSGFTLTNANYNNAVDLLRERFGQVHKITNAYMQALLQLPSPYNNLNSLRDIHDKLEAYVRGLEALGEKQESYGSMLVPVIIGKLPPDMRKSLARENGSDRWILSELRSAIRRELNILEAGQGVADVPEVNYSTASFFTRMDAGRRDRQMRNQGNQINRNQQYRKQVQRSNVQRPPQTCAFCNGNHLSNDCNQVKDYNQRIQIVRRDRLCFNCLGKHQVSACTSNFKCRICRRRHHTSICTGNALPSQSQNFPLSRTQSTSQQQSESSVLHTNTYGPVPDVLLKTAIAPICTETICTDANILLDEGAQRSFITEKLAEQLHVTRTGSDTIHIASFGDSTQSVRHIDTALVYLKTDRDERIPLHVLIVPTIAVPLSNRVHRTATKLPYLKNLKLAHPVTTDDMFDISVLIGADYYWQIVKIE